MDVDEKRMEDLNELYKEHESDIASIHSALKREMPLLVQEYKLSFDQTAALDEYINDRVTIFRYLRKNGFLIPHTLSRMLDTLKWRIHKNVGLLTVEDQNPAFFEGPFCFFHGNDRIGRPVVLIQLSYLPDIVGDASEFLSPFITFVFETSRRITCKASMDRMKNGEKNPIVTESVLLIDFKKAKSLPRDRKIAGAFIKMIKRYPSSLGAACLLNFGWMYQGIWQMVKLLLTEEAKSRVSFPKVAELSRWIDQPDFIAALEGPDPVTWDWNRDPTFRRQEQPPPLSRSSSSSSIYFDAELYTPEMDSEPSLEEPITESDVATSGTSKPETISLQTNALATDENTPSSITTIKTVTTITEQTALTSRPSTSTAPHHPSNLALQILAQLELLMRRFMTRGFRKVMAYRNTLCWVLACIILRNRLFQVLQAVLVLLGELFAKRLKLPDPSSAGIRILLSLTGNSMGRLLTL
ncbi:hypothetical protein BX666DRAFT_1938284 [Dichotomocladium elegans]|nr:hypothetical protein BX666DRAFT_1938284 [Dichotomocladium elegans]